jgi:hypothetical protein
MQNQCLLTLTVALSDLNAYQNEGKVSKRIEIQI